MSSTVPRLNRLNPQIYLFYNIFGLIITSLAFNAIFKLPLPKELEQGGHFQFLTNLSLLITIITIVSNILTLVSTNNFVLNSNLYLNAISIILETLVALIYWSLRVFFVHLIVPEGVTPDKFIPFHIDASIHLFPIFFLSIDYYLIKTKNFNINSLVVISMVFGLTSAYWILLEILVIPPASYPYPFLNVETKERAIIFILVGIFGLVFYYISNGLHNPIQKLIYGVEKVEEKLKGN